MHYKVITNEGGNTNMKMKKVLAIGLSAAMIMSVTPGTVTAADLDADVAVEEVSDDEEEVVVSEEPEVEENDSDEVIEIEFQDENESQENEQIDVFDAGAETTSDVAELGKCGDNLTYIISGDESTGCKLTINGTGDMYDYNENNLVP